MLNSPIAVMSVEASFLSNTSKFEHFLIMCLSNHSMGFPCGSAGKESACNVGDLGSIPGLRKFPWRRERLSTPVFWPGEFHGLYSPWGHKESDTTEWLCFKSFNNSFQETLSFVFFKKIRMKHKIIISSQNSGLHSVIWIYIFCKINS